jgi:L-fucose isomerase-like protein
MRRKPKIGIVNLCHEDYIDEEVRRLGSEAVSALQARGADIVTAQPIGSAKQALDVGINMCAEDLDGIVLFLGSWTECATAMAFLREIEHLPLCLWGVPMFERDGRLESTGSYVSFAMFRGSMARAGYRFLPVLGEILETADSVFDFCVAAMTKTALRRTRIGLVGYTSMSIYPGTFDHLLVRRMIGPEIHHIDNYTLINIAESAAQNDIAESEALLRSRSAIDKEVSQAFLTKASRLLYALRTVCRQFSLNAINVKCQYELSKEYKMTACVPLSALAELGVVSSCEGDMLNTISMTVLALLTGQVVTYGDAINHIGNVVKFSSCGFAPFSLADGDPVVRNFMPHPGFTGIQTSFTLKPGRVTVLRLVEDVGDYHILYFTGEGLPSELRQGVMPALDVRLDGDIGRLVSEYSGQHFALCYGDCSAKIECLCTMLGIRAVRV